MEIALDSRSNCSPDHPTSPTSDWFYKRQDGTIKYAENPPKKYEIFIRSILPAKNWQRFGRRCKASSSSGPSTGCAFFASTTHTQAGRIWEFLIAGVREKFPDTFFFRKLSPARK